MSFSKINLQALIQQKDFLIRQRQEYLDLAQNEINRAENAGSGLLNNYEQHLRLAQQYSEKATSNDQLLITLKILLQEE